MRMTMHRCLGSMCTVNRSRMCAGGVQGATAVASAHDRLVAHFKDGGLMRQHRLFLLRALRIIEAPAGHDNESGSARHRDDHVDTLQAPPALPQHDAAHAAAGEHAAREGTVITAALGPAAADTADAPEPGIASVHSGRMDAWEEHLAASCITLHWMEDLMHPSSSLSLRVLVVEATTGSASHELGMPCRHRGLFLPSSITEAPAPQGVAGQVSRRRPYTRCLQVRCGTCNRACMPSTAAVTGGSRGDPAQRRLCT